jgi:hypothetical protein
MNRIRTTWAGVAILATLVALSGPAVTAAEQASPAAQPKPAPKVRGDYVRIRVSPKAVVYVQFSGGEMRMATTGAGLKTAKPVKAKRHSSDHSEFGEVTLPVPAQGLPAGFTKVTAQLDFDRTSLPSGLFGRGAQRTYVFATLGLCQKDSAGALWTYAMRYSAQPGRSLVEAPEIKVAQLSPLRLEVIAKVARKRLGAGVHVWSGKVEVDDILKNGKPAEAQMRVLDNRGVAVVAAKGPLAKFGFG